MKEIFGLGVDVEHGTAAPRPLDEADGAIQHAFAILGLPMRRSRLGRRHGNRPVRRGRRGRPIHRRRPTLAGLPDIHANLFLVFGN
jgi:hypothetical protein